jgi:hypothetical protein
MISNLGCGVGVGGSLGGDVGGSRGWREVGGGSWRVRGGEFGRGFFIEKK